jgi:hypothetical protein
MRKPLIIFALFAATVFGAGYLIGQLRGVSTGSAASLNPTQTRAQIIQWGGLRDSFRANDLGTPPGPHVDGMVTAVNGDTVIIKPDGATNANNETETVTTITLTGSTQYGAGASASSGKSSITVGSFVIAEGQSALTVSRSQRRTSMFDPAERRTAAPAASVAARTSTAR